MEDPPRAVDTRMARLLAAAEELAQMGSFELDLRSGKVLWSAGFNRILGLDPSARRRSVPEILELIHPDDRERIERLLVDMADRSHEMPEQGLVVELRMLHADGSARELRGLGRVEREEGQSERWIGSVQDITEQRLSERELRAHYSVSQVLREWESFELGVVDLLRRIATALEYPMASLWLWDEAAEVLACRAFWSAPDVDPGDFEQIARNATFGEGEGKPGRAWQSREPVITADIASDPDFRHREAAAEQGITSAVAFPAIGPGGPVAVLSFYSLERRVPSANLVHTLTALGGELGRFLSRRQAGLGSRPLSGREIEVLRLAAEGLSGPEIAEQLVLGPATVKTHFEHVYEKLGVGDRAAAVAQALRTGVID
jgi:PAS domain S-box-containing protein